MRISILEAIAGELPSNVGSKKFDRNTMPQLKLPDLQKHHIPFKRAKIDIDRIKPVQTQRVPGLAQKVARDFHGKDKPFILDKNGYLVNGHHRYDAARMLGIDTVDAIFVEVDIEDLINMFPQAVDDTPIVDEDNSLAEFQQKLKIALEKRRLFANAGGGGGGAGGGGAAGGGAGSGAGAGTGGGAGPGDGSGGGAHGNADGGGGEAGSGSVSSSPARGMYIGSMPAYSKTKKKKKKKKKKSSFKFGKGVYETVEASQDMNALIKAINEAPINRSSDTYDPNPNDAYKAATTDTTPKYQYDPERDYRPGKSLGPIPNIQSQTEVIVMPDGIIYLFYVHEDVKQVPEKTFWQSIKNFMLDQNKMNQTGPDKVRNILGFLSLSPYEDGYKVRGVGMDPSIQKQGRAIKLYMAFSAWKKVPIYSDYTQTPGAIHMWKSIINRYPSKVVAYDQKTKQDIPLDKAGNMYQDEPVDFTKQTQFKMGQTLGATKLFKLLPESLISSTIEDVIPMNKADPGQGPVGKKPFFSPEEADRANDEYNNQAQVDQDDGVIVRSTDGKQYRILRNEGESQYFELGEVYLSGLTDPNYIDIEGYPDAAELLYYHSATGHYPSELTEIFNQNDFDKVFKNRKPNFSNRNLNPNTRKYVDNHKWKKVLVNIDDLDDNAYDDQFGRIIDVDSEVGVNFKDPIMVHADGKTIIDGFHRVYQAKKGGLKQLPAYIPEGISIQYTKPNLDVEWKEAERYPELAELGLEGWKALKGQQVNVKQLGGPKNIQNTEGTDVNTAKKAIATLEPAKVQRMQQAITSGAVELPIIAKFHSGEFDLIAGNTRFTGLVANGILPEVYYIDLTTQLNETVTTGDCYEANGRAFQDNNSPTARLIHADITPRLGNMAGSTYGHAWIEDGNKLVDHTTVGTDVMDLISGFDDLPDNLRVSSKSIFYGIADPKNIKRYDSDAFFKMITKHQTWGPWETTSEGAFIDQFEPEYSEKKREIANKLRKKLGLDPKPELDWKIDLANKMQRAEWIEQYKDIEKNISKIKKKIKEQGPTQTPKYLYHVTFKSNIQNIKAKGLEQFHTSLWVKGPEGKRYNQEAGIFAFDHPLDAIQWAQKMEWEFRNDIIPNTNDDIAIIRVDMQDGEEIWGDDPSDDIMLTRHGKSLRSRQNIKADKIIDAFSMAEFGKAGVLKISREQWLSQVQQKLAETAKPPEGWISHDGIGKLIGNELGANAEDYWTSFDLVSDDDLLRYQERETGNIAADTLQQHNLDADIDSVNTFLSKYPKHFHFKVSKLRYDQGLPIWYAEPVNILVNDVNEEYPIYKTLDYMNRPSREERQKSYFKSLVDKRKQRELKDKKDKKKDKTNERPLTKDEEDDKEKYVKGMKKNKKDFKKRYGKNADAVMYATATKMAKENVVTEGIDSYGTAYHWAIHAFKEFIDTETDWNDDPNNLFFDPKNPDADPDVGVVVTWNPGEKHIVSYHSSGRVADGYGPDAAELHITPEKDYSPHGDVSDILGAIENGQFVNVVLQSKDNMREGKFKELDIERQEHEEFMQNYPPYPNKRSYSNYKGNEYVFLNPNNWPHQASMNSQQLKNLGFRLSKNGQWYMTVKKYKGVVGVLR